MCVHCEIEQQFVRVLLCVLKGKVRGEAENTTLFTHHIALMHLWIHGELNHEPGGISQDKCCNQVPVDDISQTPDTPGRRKDGGGQRRKGGKRKS